MKSKIFFNGREYASVDEMPADVRQAYERAMSVFADGDRNGTPDILEDGANVNVHMVSHAKIIFNGQEFGSVDEMPPEARRAYEQVMGKFDANRDGVPDVLQGSFQADVRSGGQVWSDQGALPAPRTVRASVNLGPFDVRLAIAGAAIVVLLAVIAVLVVLLVFPLMAPR